MKQILKSSLAAILLQLSCAGLFASAQTTKTSTQMCVIIDNPTSFEVELWMKSGKHAIDYADNDCYRVQPGQTITCSISVESSVHSRQDANQRLSCYAHPTRKPAPSWIGNIEKCVDGKTDDIDVGDTTSYIAFASKEKAVHLALEVERVTPHEEFWQVDPFDVIHVIKK